MTMRRGSIVHYLMGGQRVRAVVITADRYNAGHGLVAPLRERAAPDLMPAFLVPLTRLDWPTASAVDLSRTRVLDQSAVAGPAGQLTPATLNSLTTAVRTYFGAIE
jgi:mRNA-degrading endonuclease toxin of MazEF toxin-antitoxin module